MLDGVLPDEPEDGPHVLGRSSVEGGTSHKTEESQELRVDEDPVNGVVTLEDWCCDEDVENDLFPLLLLPISKDGDE